MKFLLTFSLLISGLVAFSAGAIRLNLATLLMTFLMAALLTVIQEWRPQWRNQGKRERQGRWRVQPFIVAGACILTAVFYMWTLLLVTIR